MFVSFLYIYNMFLNIPNYPRCFDRDSMPALTLAGVASASLGTNFAGGVCRFSQEPKKFHIPFIWIKVPEWYTVVRQAHQPSEVPELAEGPLLAYAFPSHCHSRLGRESPLASSSTVREGIQGRIVLLLLKNNP